MRTRDNRQRFLIESCGVRGQICHLDDTWREATARVDYPPLVRELLGETFVAALLLAGTIKFDGRMTLQIRGDGVIHLLVVQVSESGSVRGLARWGELPAQTSTLDASAGAEPPPLAALFGDDARMIITIEARERAEPYQGIVPLEGASLGDALASYFRNSEQLQTELYLSADATGAAGMLLQRLPAGERESEDAEGWRRATTLAGTLGGEELRERDVEGLLHALFHEERVRLFDESPVRFDCSCSRERTDGMLQGLGEAEVQSIVEELGAVEITCEFCDAEYRYDAVDVAALFHATLSGDDAGAPDEETVRH